MNFNKNDLTLELDKNESEIKLENEINELFDFADLKSELMIEYYNQILSPYLISLNLNPNDYCEYDLYFYSDDSQVCLFKDGTNREEAKVRIELNLEMLEKTNQFLKNKKYEKVIKKIQQCIQPIKKGNKKPFYINTLYVFSFSYFFDTKNRSHRWKNDLIDKEIYDFFCRNFKFFINIKNQHDFTFTKVDNLIKVYYKNHFVFNFLYQRATNKKELIDLFLKLKKEIEYQMNMKKRLKSLY